MTDRSDITASSQSGIDGTVLLNTPDLDPVSGLIKLTESLINAANQLAPGCGRSAKANTFTSIGRGGLPSHPNNLLTGMKPSLRLVDTVNVDTKVSRDIISEVINHESNDSQDTVIQQAQGWIITSDGRVILTARAMEANPDSSSFNYAVCPVSHHP